MRLASPSCMADCIAEVEPRVLGSPVNRYVANGCPHGRLENEKSTHVLCETSTPVFGMKRGHGWKALFLFVRLHRCHV